MGSIHSTPGHRRDDIILRNALINRNSEEVSTFVDGKSRVMSGSAFFLNPIHCYHAIMHQNLDFF